MKVARGFTLTELLVGLAVTSITLVTLATGRATPIPEDVKAKYSI